MQVRGDTGCFLIFLNMNDIILRKVGEPEFNSLPRGVALVWVGEKPVFVRKNGTRLLPVSSQEQSDLTQKHIKNAGR